jgi:3-methyladenine DNA glycosylase/8-oxoguanine DNA glycosylase
MHSQQQFLLRFSGAYSLSASTRLAARSSFIEDMQIGQDPDLPTLDVAFPVEGTWGTVGVRVTQQHDELRANILANPQDAPINDIREQLERMLCLDTEARDLATIVARDRVVAELDKQRPGLRPVLFPSPYEAAAKAIIGHRLFVRQAASVSSRVARDYGTSVTVEERSMSGFPAPELLATLSPVQGLSELKVKQLRALGVFAAGGGLSTSRLRAMKYDEALSYLQQLGGIGPFSAELIMLRGVGDADAFPLEEKRLHRAMAAAYHLGPEPDLATLERVADQWRPFRSWIGLLLRNSDFSS